MSGLPFTLYIDKELQVVHTTRDCSGTTIPSKYGYLDHAYVTTVEQAKEIDRVYKPCERCKSRAKRSSRAPGWRRS